MNSVKSLDKSVKETDTKLHAGNQKMLDEEHNDEKLVIELLTVVTNWLLIISGSSYCLVDYHE